ncbi:MAG: adenylate/guanylate cyclase domain-containing protein, partial [Saprospiraceae bacterium]|nr:adenylate/guanylate cyclase domain-containing protein [Saprospiraceae bacterium]
MVRWLEQDKRVSYRAMKRQFGLDDEYLEDLKEAILYAHPVEDDGKGMIWRGAVETPEQGQIREGDPTPSQAKTTAERRQLTVMFCDLAGSTTLSQRLDPEDLREVIRCYQSTAAEAIARYDGYIAQYLGDGLLVYFGWPRAHEDDPKRAVLSGLDIVKRIITNLNTTLSNRFDVLLSVRIGIHTGPVVVGQVGAGDSRENLAMGETVNVAARLEALAEPDTIVISNTTERLLQDAFILEERGLHQLKGIEEQVAIYRVLEPLDAHSTDDPENQKKGP